MIYIHIYILRPTLLLVTYDCFLSGVGIFSYFAATGPILVLGFRRGTKPHGRKLKCSADFSRLLRQTSFQFHCSLCVEFVQRAWSESVGVFPPGALPLLVYSCPVRLRMSYCAREGRRAIQCLEGARRCAPGWRVCKGPCDIIDQRYAAVGVFRPVRSSWLGRALMGEPMSGVIGEDGFWSAPWQDWLFAL